MSKLNENWLWENWIDLELKQYMLLAYMQEVESEFLQNKIYPSLHDLGIHYHNAQSLKQSKTDLHNQFKSEITGLKWTKSSIELKRNSPDDERLNELERIIEFSLPHLKRAIVEGQGIYDFIESKIELKPIGVMALREHEGYLFIQNGESRKARVYEYQISQIERANEKFKAIYTQFLGEYALRINYTIEHIKEELINKEAKYAHPATFLAESSLKFPIDEALLPVVKRSLVRKLAS